MYSDRMHRAGGVLLAIAGVVGVIVGLTLLFRSAALGGLFGLLSAFVPVLSAYAAVILVFSLIQIVGGYYAYTGTNWYAALIGSVLGIFSAVTLPLSVVGAFLVVLGEGTFEDSPVRVATVAEETVEMPGESMPSDD